MLLIWASGRRVAGVVRMCNPEMFVESCLQRQLVLRAIRPMTQPGGTEHGTVAKRAGRFHRNVSQPFRNAQVWLLYSRHLVQAVSCGLRVGRVRLSRFHMHASDRAPLPSAQISERPS